MAQNLSNVIGLVSLYQFLTTKMPFAFFFRTFNEVQPTFRSNALKHLSSDLRNKFPFLTQCAIRWPNLGKMKCPDEMSRSWTGVAIFTKIRQIMIWLKEDWRNSMDIWTFGCRSFLNGGEGMVSWSTICVTCTFHLCWTKYSCKRERKETPGGI